MGDVHASVVETEPCLWYDYVVLLFTWVVVSWVEGLEV